MKWLFGIALCGASAIGCGDDAPGETTATGGSGAGGSGGVGTGAAGASGPGGAGGTSAGGQGGAAEGGAGAAGPGGAGGAGGGGGAVDPPPGRLRVVAANLSSGNLQSYDPGHGIRILQGLDADVVLLQEFNYKQNSGVHIQELVDAICEDDPACDYQRGPTAQIPNGVISRLPILESGSWNDPEVDNRNFVWARIDVAGPRDLWAISVHFLTSNATDRNLEAQAVMAEIADHVPADDLVVFGGDLNTNSREEAAITTLSSVFSTGSPYPADHDGNTMTNEPRTSPYDWVIADAELSAWEVPVEIGQSVFTNGAVIDTRVYEPLSEIAPALLGDSGAVSMQHMAVVKDFLVPAPR